MKDRDDRRESRAKKVCKKKRDTWAKLKQRKLNVNPTRLGELEQLQRAIQGGDQPSKPLEKIICVNIQKDVEEALLSTCKVAFYASDMLPMQEIDSHKRHWYSRHSGGKTHSDTEPTAGPSNPDDSVQQAQSHDTPQNTKGALKLQQPDTHDPLEHPDSQAIPQQPDDQVPHPNHPADTTMAITLHTTDSTWYPLKHFFKQHATTSQALLYEIDPSLSQEFHESVLAMSTLLRLPVVVLCRPDPTKFPEAAGLADKEQAYTRAWKVHEGIEGFVQDVTTELPKLVALCDAIAQSVESKVGDLRKVNGWLHGAKRGAVAFVPFGVHVVNFMGIARLVHRMLKRTGMLNDKEAKKTARLEAAATGAKLVVIDSMGDVYQYAIFATVLAGFAVEASASGVDVALASLDALDFAMLGSISVVTGAVSAVGAYINRPHMVEAIARFITTLQLVYLLDPGMRRTVEDCDGVGQEVGPQDDGGDEEEMRPLLAGAPAASDSVEMTQAVRATRVEDAAPPLSPIELAARQMMDVQK